MLRDERQNNILTTLQTDGVASVRDLAETFNVSESTIRRDLEVLDRHGELTRSYGGALLRPRTTVEEDGGVADEGDFSTATDGDLKHAVAKRAAALVEDGQVVLLDIGTTAPLIARRLRGREITVVTSSLAVFDELRDDDKVRLVLLGGVVRRHFRSLVGSLAALSLTQVSADLLFLSCTGVRANGHIVDNMAVEAPIKQAMIEASDRVVLLAPETKFPGSGALRLCAVSDVDVLVTTAGAPTTTLDLCRNAGGEVVIA